MSIMKLLPAAALLLLFSCSDNTSVKNEKTQEIEEQNNISDQVLKATNEFEKRLVDYDKIVTIKHSELAKEGGAYTPPSIVSIFSNEEVNSELIKHNQLVGLDLPFKVLFFAEPDTSQVWVAYTSSSFIKRRHDLSNNDLKNYRSHINEIRAHFPTTSIVTPELSHVKKDFGIVKIKSDFSFDTTIAKLKTIVNKQSDTKWFGEVEFEHGKTILLLFGGPVPGAKAMNTCPQLGLDAFCQKLLVYKNANKEIIVAYNDIEAFAQLYCNSVTPPQKMINKRLFQTFSQAIQKKAN